MANGTASFLQPTRVELLHRFLDEQIRNGGRAKPLDDLLSAFPAYEREMLEVLTALQEGQNQCDAGQCTSLDELKAEAERQFPFLTDAK